MSMPNRMETLAEGLKLIGLLTPEARDNIVKAFMDQEVQMIQQQTDINQLRDEITQLQERMDRVQHYITEAGRKY